MANRPKLIFEIMATPVPEIIVGSLDFYFRWYLLNTLSLGTLRNITHMLCVFVISRRWRSAAGRNVIYTRTAVTKTFMLLINLRFFLCRSPYDSSGTDFIFEGNLDSKRKICICNFKFLWNMMKAVIMKYHCWQFKVRIAVDWTISSWCSKIS
jgi:hypothetical protein